MVKLVNITYNSSDDYYPIELDECLISNDYDDIVIENEDSNSSDIMFE